MHRIGHTLGRLIETSLSDGVNIPIGSCVVTLLYKGELIIINNVHLPNAGY